MKESLEEKVDIEEDDIIQYLKRHTLKNCSKVPEMIEHNTIQSLQKPLKILINV